MVGLFDLNNNHIGFMLLALLGSSEIYISPRGPPNPVRRPSAKKNCPPGNPALLHRLCSKSSCSPLREAASEQQHLTPVVLVLVVLAVVASRAARAEVDALAVDRQEPGAGTAAPAQRLGMAQA